MMHDNRHSKRADVTYQVLKLDLRTSDQRVDDSWKEYCNKDFYLEAWILRLLLLLVTCLNVFNMQQRSRVKRFAWSPRCFDFMYKNCNLYLHKTWFSFWTLYQKCAILQESPQFRQHIYIRKKMVPCSIHWSVLC